MLDRCAFLTPALLAFISSCATAAAPPCPVAARPASTPPSAPQEKAAAAPSAGYDASPWLEDLGALFRELSSHYANLEWAVTERRMDLPGLKSKTEQRLREAKSDPEARRALDAFLEAFGDGHLFLAWDEPKPLAASTPATAATTLCARLGYGKREPKPGVDFALTGAFTAVDDADAIEFPGGIVRLPNDAKLGTIRIGLFMEQLHPALCEAARRELALADDAACDDSCKEQLMMSVMDRMTASLERRAVALGKAGAAALVIDLTRNGGGNDWADPAARVLTKIPLRTARLGFVRHEHWAQRFREDLKDVQADRAKKDEPVLASAEATLKAALDLAAAPCDRSALWVAGAPKPSCAQLATAQLTTSGLVAYAKPGAFDGRASANALFSPRQFKYHEGRSTLPLVVLVDGQTASASEQFTSLLVDNHAALVVGALTTGSGCGFTNGGIPATLPRSGAHLHAPDCARLRADGTNEVSGLVPDVLLPLASRDSPYQRATKVAAGLATAWKILGARAK